MADRSFLEPGLGEPILVVDEGRPIEHLTPDAVAAQAPLQHLVQLAHHGGPHRADRVSRLPGRHVRLPQRPLGGGAHQSHAVHGGPLPARRTVARHGSGDPVGVGAGARRGITLFTAAYMAEIVRGGLQSVPRGPDRSGAGARALPVRQTGYIVLPQALRNVIPPDRPADQPVQGHHARRHRDGSVRAPQRDHGGHGAGRVPGQGLIGETLTFAAPAVLDGVVHDEPREPATRTTIGSGRQMTDDPQPATRRRGRRSSPTPPRCAARRGDDRARARRQVLRRLPGAEATST
jgi:hypothetical protein